MTDMLTVTSIYLGRGPVSSIHMSSYTPFEGYVWSWGEESNKYATNVQTPFSRESSTGRKIAPGKRKAGAGQSEKQREKVRGISSIAGRFRLKEYFLDIDQDLTDNLITTEFQFCSGPHRKYDETKFGPSFRKCLFLSP